MLQCLNQIERSDHKADKVTLIVEERAEFPGWSGALICQNLGSSAIPGLLDSPVDTFFQLLRMGLIGGGAKPIPAASRALTLPGCAVPYE